MQHLNMCLKGAVREAINAYVLAIRIKRCPDHISTVTGAESMERLARLIHVFGISHAHKQNVTISKPIKWTCIGVLS